MGFNNFYRLIKISRNKTFKIKGTGHRVRYFHNYESSSKFFPVGSGCIIDLSAKFECYLFIHLNKFFHILTSFR